MATLPSSTSLANVADGAQIVASDHRNNYSAIQTALNALITILAAGTSGQVFASSGGTTVGWANPAAANPPYFLTGLGSAVSGLTANTAYYAPVVVQAAFSPTSIRWAVGTQSGNYDVGIYDSSFAKLWSRGSTACPTVGSVTTAISAGSPTSLTLPAGTYWLAFAFDNGTAGIRNAPAASISGLAYSKATSFPLPSSLASGTTPPDSATLVQVAMF